MTKKAWKIWAKRPRKPKVGKFYNEISGGGSFQVVALHKERDYCGPEFIVIGYVRKNNSCYIDDMFLYDFWRRYE